MILCIHTPAKEKRAPYLIAIFAHGFVIKWDLQTIPVLSGINEVNIRSVLKPDTFNNAKLWTGVCCDLGFFGSGLAFSLEKSVILKSVIFYNFEHPLTSSCFPAIVLSIFVTINLKCR